MREILKRPLTSLDSTEQNDDSSVVPTLGENINSEETGEIDDIESEDLSYLHA